VADHVVDRGSVEFREFGGIYLVVLRNGAVDAEYDWLRFTRQVRNVQWALRSASA
jgi:hypothetical protein